ncbi:chorismate-binding protein [Aurantibacter crassamenti]|uniref:isochorismate synthase n=1 Tax=Aurantibacter crassamenti TaxID=1837375 RepID=UPI001939E9AC|nr:isochorismate synthase [Aurantibacter crassamenti]MBM1107424.1 chorismate-binding protein [Aurantibacter crassamenti]
MWQRIEKQLSDQLPFVVYCKPRQTEIKAIFQKDKSLTKVSDFTESGFVFAPFESKDAAVLIKNDEHIHLEFSEEKQEISLTQPLAESNSGRDPYIKLLRKTIHEIESGAFTKVVLSRNLKVESKTSPITLFRRIVSLYRNAFCYLWYHPEVGMWLGATPEILLQTENSNLTTMSLAGTLPYERIRKPNWSFKELDEQALVTKYILDALQGKVEELQESDLETIRAGELVHLRTKITGVLQSNKLNEIIDALHPTPAVCGFPKKNTMNFILDNEDYDRQFYAGFLGELNFGLNMATTLYVNLRCMQKIDNIMKIYVGGGVTKDSDPEKEWQETVNKSQTMLRVLYN